METGRWNKMPSSGKGVVGKEVVFLYGRWEAIIKSMVNISRL